MEDFLKNIETKVIILNEYATPNETMYINMFQRSRFTVDLSAKVAHIGIQYQISYRHSLSKGEYIYNKF